MLRYCSVLRVGKPGAHRMDGKLSLYMLLTQQPACFRALIRKELAVSITVVACSKLCISARNLQVSRKQRTQTSVEDTAVLA